MHLWYTKVSEYDRSRLNGFISDLSPCNDRAPFICRFALVSELFGNPFPDFICCLPNVPRLFHICLTYCLVYN